MYYSPSATAGNKRLVIGIAYNGGALGGSVAYGKWEVDAVQELFHLLVECCATDYNLVEFAAKSHFHLFADFLFHLLVDKRDITKQAHLSSL